MSYALYTIHAPIIMICSSISAKLLGADLPTFAPWGGIVLIVFMVILAATLNRVYDGPVRRYLTKWTANRTERLQALRP